MVELVYSFQTFFGCQVCLQFEDSAKKKIFNEISTLVKGLVNVACTGICPKDTFVRIDKFLSRYRDREATIERVGEVWVIMPGFRKKCMFSDFFHALISGLPKEFPFVESMFVATVSSISIPDQPWKSSDSEFNVRTDQTPVSGPECTAFGTFGKGLNYGEKARFSFLNTCLDKIPGISSGISSLRSRRDEESDASASSQWRTSDSTSSIPGVSQWNSGTSGQAAAVADAGWIQSNMTSVDRTSESDDKVCLSPPMSYILAVNVFGHSHVANMARRQLLPAYLHQPYTHSPSSPHVGAHMLCISRKPKFILNCSPLHPKKNLSFHVAPALRRN